MQHIVRTWWRHWRTWRLSREVSLAQEDWHTHLEQCRDCIMDRECSTINLLRVRKEYWEQQLVQFQQGYI